MTVSAPQPRAGQGDLDALRVAMSSNNYRPRVSGVAVAVEFLERALRSAGCRTLVIAPDYEPDCSDGHAGVLCYIQDRWRAFPGGS